MNSVLALSLLACGAATRPGVAATGNQAQQTATARTAPKPKPRFATLSAATAERVSKLWVVAAGGHARAVAIDRARGQVAFSSGSPVKLYALDSGKPAGKLSSCPGVLRSGLHFHAGKLFVVCDTGVQVYEVVSRRRLSPLKVHTSKITAAAFSGDRMALGHHDGVVRVYALSNGALMTEVPVPGPPIDVKSLSLTEDGKTLAVAWVQGSIWWWRLDDPSTFHKLVRHESESDSVAFSRDGRLFAEEGKPSFTTVWSFASDPKPHASLRNGAWVKRLLFTHDSKWLIRGGSDGLELAEVAGKKRVVLDSSGKVEDVALDETGALIVAGDRAGRLSVWGVR